jgi:hypoxanthine phosphoribosyltransferase
VDIPIDYIGFEVPDKFVVGYGLDYKGEYRNLPFVGVLRPELIRNGIPVNDMPHSNKIRP